MRGRGRTPPPPGAIFAVSQPEFLPPREACSSVLVPMSAIRSAALLVNTRSRWGRSQFDPARRRLSALSIQVDAHAVDDPDTLRSRLDAALARGPDLIVLGGGDGTISSVVGALPGTGVPLAILPLGTANSFARTLGLPLDIDGAVEVIRTGTLRRIDLGMVNDCAFANMAAIGLAPVIADTIPDGLKRWLGRAGYLGWAALQFARFRTFRLSVDCRNMVQRMPAVEVRISNGRFQGGTEVVGDARLDSGEMLVQAVRGPRRTLVRDWGARLLGLPPRAGDEVTFRGRELRIDTDPPLPISIDGEVRACTPATIRVLPAAIDVMTPAEAGQRLFQQS